MAEKIEFPTWSFEPGLREAWHRETGEAVQFTRAERALLNAFIESSGRVLQRDLLLDAVAGLDAEAADRSIDFIIHRLRRKLRDEPRHPRYIATQYGEGYVWVAETVSTQQPAAGAFMAVGPVRGLDFTGALAGRGWLFARLLCRELDQGTAPDSTVVMDGNCPPVPEFSEQPPEFGLTLDFLETGDAALDCVLTLRRFQSERILRVERITVCKANAAQTTERRAAVGMAHQLLDAIWQASQALDPALATPETELVAVRLHEASENLTGTQETWNDAAQRLRRSLQAHPGDAETQLRLAATLHSRYVLTPPTTPIDPATRSRDEAEIEYLVQAALPRVHSQGVFALTAAKLLYFVNKAHRQLALDIAEQAFASTTAFANAFAIVGQLRMWEGDMDQAMTLYDRGLQLVRHGSYFHLYLLVLKMQAELILRRDHSPSGELLFSLVPIKNRGRDALLWAPVVTGTVRTAVNAYMDDLDASTATAVIRYQHYLAARHFRYKTHRQNVLRRPASLLLERFGAGVIPADIRPDVPDDLIG